MTGAALILAGHGSHISPNTAGIVWRYVDTLRRRGVAGEITACFWKEQPHFHQVLKTVTAPVVVVVPVLAAAGFFSRQVIPAEMRLAGSITRRDGRAIHYTPTLGEHPYVQRVVQQRVQAVLDAASLPPQDTAAVIIGHGTRRSAETRATTQRQVAHLQAQRLTAQVVDAYLDDDPDIPSIYHRTTAQHVIAVPFFLAEGSHTTQDVPQALGITHDNYPAHVNGRQVYYTPPIGTDEVICELILQLARDTGYAFAEYPSAALWAGFPQAGSDGLCAALAEAGTLIFGQLRLTPSEVAPVNSTRRVVLGDAPALRQHLREKPFRPLATAADLPADWVVEVESPAAVPAVVETVYPGVLADWAAQQRGSFRAERLADTLARQQGMFRQLAGADIAGGVARVCGRCVLRPAWHTIHTAPDELPCAAPCNHLLSDTREYAL
jgi:sirohydrochlorin cobaltochelatase